MSHDIKGPLTPKTSQETVFSSQESEKDKQKSLLKKPQKDVETDKENIDISLEKQNEAKEAGVNPKKFNGPGQKPQKTANKAFGGISDFVLFFEHRNPEMKQFAKEFERIEKMNSELSIAELNRVIAPKIEECLNQMYQKTQTATKSKIFKRENKYAGLFKSSFNTWEEFYKQVLRAYTISGFLYRKMNEYLRNEDWMELDALLPYVYCLFKAFLWGPTGLRDQESFEALKAKTKENKLILYRGADFDDESLEFYDPEKIKNFSWNGVISTSLIESVTKKFQGDSSKRPILITIEVDFEHMRSEDLNGLYLAAFSEYPKEEEVALPPGSIFELLGINKESLQVEMRLRLVTNAKYLAHEGQLLHGMLQAIMRNENELKIVCLKEKDLSRALKHCKGNQLIKDLEFCFCTFNQKAIEVLNEVIATIENLTSLTLNIVRLEESCQLESVFECIGKTGIKKIQILDTPMAEGHIQDLIKGIKRLGSLEYLKLTFEEECEMDAELFIHLLEASSQYLDPQCILDVDIGTSYNLMARGFKLCDFEQSGGIDAIKKSWPAGWGSPPKSFEVKNPTSDHEAKQHLVPAVMIKEKPMGDCKMEDNDILDSFEPEDERYENIEIIGSPEGMWRYCMAGVERETLLEVLESKFRLTPERKENDKLAKDDAEEQDYFQENRNTREIKQNNKLELLTSLHLHFKRVSILDSNIFWLCMHELKHLRSLTTLHLSWKDCKNLTNEGLRVFSCEGIKGNPFLASLKLDFGGCSQITDEGLKSLSSEGIQHLSQLTSLYLYFGGCSNITDDSLKSLSSESIQHLSQLTSLYLYFGGCSNITDEGLRSLSSGGIQHLSQLTSLYLDFGGCSKITDEGLKSLSSGGIQHLSQLTSLYLDFGDCSKITDEGLKSLSSEGIQHLSQLTSLYLYFGGCKNITDDSLKSLSSESIQHLSQLTSLYLYFGGCSNITDEGLRSLSSGGIQHLSQLTSLHLYFGSCSKITAEGLKSLCSEEITSSSKLTWLFLNFCGCERVNKERLKNICSEETKYRSIQGGFFEYRCPRGNSQDLLLPGPLISDFNPGASVSYNVQPGFYFKQFPLKSGSSFVKLLANYSPSDLKEKQSLKNYHVLLHLNSLPDNIAHQALDQKDIFDALEIVDKTNQRDILVNWQGTEALSLIFNVRTGDLETEKFAKFYKNIIQCFKSIKKLHLRSNEDNRFSDNVLRGLFCERMENLNSLEKINFIFPTVELGETVQKLILRGSASCVSLTFFTKRKMRRRNKDLQLCSQNFLFPTLNPNFQISKVQNQKTRRLFQNNLKQRSLFPFVKVFHMYPQHATHQVDFSRQMTNSLNKGQQSKSELVSKKRGIRENYLSVAEEIISFQEKFKSSTSREIDFSCNKNIPIQELSFKEFSDLKSLNLNFSGQNDFTNEELNSLSLTISCLKSLEVLNLRFRSCKGVKDEGLLSLGSQGLKHLSKLTELYLDFGLCNSITDKGLDYLGCKGIKYLELLTNLNLNFECCSSLENLKCQVIGSLKCLTELHLNFSNSSGIIDIGREGLFCGLQNLKSLTILSLDFEYYKAYDLDLQSLSQEIQRLEALTDLNLNFSNCARITDIGLDWLSDGIQHLKSLIILSLNFGNGPRISDQGLQSLSCKGIQCLKPLTTLSLKFDKCPEISDNGIKDLSCKGIRDLKLLTSLSLTFDDTLTNKGLKTLCCEGIRHLTSLVSLHLNICKGISDEGIESLCCEGILHLDNLTTLELISQGENTITDQGIKNLAFKAIPKFVSLDSLQLPLMQTVTSSSSISEAFKNILIYFGLQKAED